MSKKIISKVVASEEIILPNFDVLSTSKELPEKHTSILLGAGFSVNQGYPTANELNDKIQKVNLEGFSVYGDGSLIKLDPSSEDPNYYMPDALSKHFVKKLIELFLKANSTFDYEEFYDFIVNPELLKRSDFKIAANEFREEINIDSKNPPFEFSDGRLIDKTIKLINQLIEFLLVDKNGESFYKPVHLCKPLPHNYLGFLELLEDLGKDSIVHIHSLNHDLLFETFNHTDWISGELSNGFDEMGSKFYGRVEDNVMIRLDYFNNSYDKRFRLYKLHGSLDQYPFRHQDGSPTEYIKIKRGVSTSNFFKETQNKNGDFEYENDFTNYYADFLSGTTAKILRYNDAGYYKEIFSHFEANLKNSDKLVIVGYGCRDSRINEIIINNYDFINKEVAIVDPYPSEDVKLFANKIGAKLIEQTPAEPLLDKI